MSRSLLKSTTLVSAMTMISRVFGLLRDIVLAALGPGPGLDAFFVALKIPNFFRRLFAEGAFAQAFVPVLSQYRQQRGDDEVRRLLDHVYGTLAIVLMVLSFFAIIGAPIVALIFAYGFYDDTAKFSLTVDLIRITFPYLFFVSLTALAGGVLNTWGKFAIPAVTPVLLNFSLIACALWLTPYVDQPARALAIGVFIAGLVQWLFQMPFLLKLRLFPRARWGWNDSGVRQVLRLMVPALFGASIMQIGLLFDVLVASYLQDGSVSWLYFADRLMEFPLGVFAIALGTVILPTLSKQIAGGDQSAYQQSLDFGLKLTLLIGAPAAFALALLSGPLVISLFHYGEFTERDVVMSQWALIPYALGLLAFVPLKVLLPAFYARHDTRTPVKVGIIALAANMLLNVVLVLALLHVGAQGPHAGLAMATVCSGVINASLLLVILKRRGHYRPGAGWAWFLVQIALACVVMSAVLWFGSATNADWLQATIWTRVGWVAALVVGGAGAYFLTLLLLGLRPSYFRAAIGASSKSGEAGKGSV